MNDPIVPVIEPAAGLVHPEEMKASVTLRVGHSVSLHMVARATPAGLVTAGLMVSGILLAVATLVWTVRRPGI